MMRIVFQGDSITDGNRYKDPECRWDLNHQIGHSYVFTIAGTLGRREPGKYNIINRGLSGDSVETITKRWQRDTLDEKPDILSLLLGINGNGNFDGVFEIGVEEHLRLFEYGYRSLLQTARAQNPALHIVLMEPFALPVGRLKTHYHAFRSVFCRKQELIRCIAEDYQAVFIPVQAQLEELVDQTIPLFAKIGCIQDPYEFWLWDGIHPTEPMHNFLAELWLNAAESIL